MRRKILAKAKEETLSRTHGDYPAALRVIEVAGEGVEHGPVAGLEAERRGLLELVKTPACENLMRLFFLQTGEEGRGVAGEAPRPHG